MTINSKTLLTALLLIFLLPGVTPAEADAYRSQAEVAAEARKRVDGRILSMKLHDRPPAPPEYRVKVLREGEVHLLRIPARRNGNNNARPRR
jgi:hypothetical protein